MKLLLHAAVYLETHLQMQREGSLGPQEQSLCLAYAC